MREIYISIIQMLVNFYNFILIDILIKTDLKLHVTLWFIIKGNHIVQDFEG